jgi:hypothetical protein
MHACAIISYASFAAGLIANALVLFSLPFIPDASLYIAEIDYIDPLNGTLNGLSSLPFTNLSSLRVSLAVFLKNYMIYFSV